jgi:hypothetical protein
MRTPQEVFEHHLQALLAGDLDEIMADYAEDAVLLTPLGAVAGRDAIRETFAGLVAGFPGLTVEVTNAVYGEQALLLQWDGGFDGGTMPNAVDTFVFADGLITVQTAAFAVVPAA